MKEHGEAETPTSNQSPCGNQGRRLLGPVVLCTFPLSLLLSQVRAHLGPGGYCQRSGNGGPQTCLPAAWLKGGPSMAQLHQHRPKTLARGQASRGRRREASLGTASSGWLTRRRRDQDQAGASLRSVLVSSLVQRGQAQARTTKASGKGFHISAMRPRLAGWQDGGHCGAQDGVTTRAFGRRRPPLVRIACTSSPPSNWPLWNPFPLNIWEEDQGLYK